MIDLIKKTYEDGIFITAEGFDDAIIGVDESQMKLIYSVGKCIEILKEEMDEEDAIEFFTFNLSGSHMGNQTPIWCFDTFV